MVYNGDGLCSVLCVCVCFLKATAVRITRAVSKHLATMRNVFSQQEVVGLLSASQLSLNVSLTNRAVGLHGTADNTAILLSFILYFLPLFFPSTAPLSGKEDGRHVNSSEENMSHLYLDLRRGEHRVSALFKMAYAVRFFCSR